MSTMPRIHIVVADDLHRRMKAVAMNGQTLKEYVTEALERAVDDDRPRRGRRTPDHGS